VGVKKVAHTKPPFCGMRSAGESHQGQLDYLKNDTICTKHHAKGKKIRRKKNISLWKGRRREKKKGTHARVKKHRGKNPRKRGVCLWGGYGEGNEHARKGVQNGTLSVEKGEPVGEKTGRHGVGTDRGRIFTPRKKISKDVRKGKTHSWQKVGAAGGGSALQTGRKKRGSSGMPEKKALKKGAEKQGQLPKAKVGAQDREGLQKQNDLQKARAYTERIAKYHGKGGENHSQKKDH